MSKQLISMYGAVAILAATAMTGCGGKKADASESGAVERVDPATAATISGTVLLEGEAPEPTPIDLPDDGVCGAVPESGDDVVVSDGRVANVFVYISKGLEGRRFEAPAKAATLDQKDCRYVPHVTGVMVGQTLKISNSDPTLHNVHAIPTVNKGFNTPQPNQGMVMEKTFDEPEVMVKFSCDVHGWMKSYVGVVSHPFFGVSGGDGAFSLAGLPPGTYTVTAWHERFGTQQQQVTVGAKESKNLTFTFTAS